MSEIGAPAKVLIVDDNADNLFVLESLLANEGHQVIVAHNGAEAISMANRDRPDLILMDLDMPVMNGWEAMKRIRTSPETAATPIVVLTAHAVLGDEERTIGPHCDAFLTKPFDPKQMISTVRQLLDSGRAAAPEAPE
jgi:two-component system cell cycle response regulator DivK